MTAHAAAPAPWRACLRLAGAAALLAAAPQLGGGASAAPAAAPSRLQLEVDARDVRHRVVSVHERIELSGVRCEVVLLLPKWLPGEHAPSGTVSRLAGLTIHAGGAAIPWQRTAADVFAFRVRPPPRSRSLDVQFQYLAPSGDTPGPGGIVREILALRWTSLVLYPAGEDLHRIRVQARVWLPAGFQWASALEAAAGSVASDRPAFGPLPLSRLFDSPLYAAAHTSRIDLENPGAHSVRLNLFSDQPAHLAATRQQIELHRALLRETDAVFGARPFSHYQFLATLSDAFGIDGLEHRECSELFLAPGYFDDWQATWDSRYLLAHEYIHAWNGKWRIPAGLDRADLNTDLNPDLLWVYEGLTQYWAKILTARAGLWSRRQALADLAVIAARAHRQPAGHWRPLLDSTRDPIINPAGETGWRSWQRYQDYYDEGALLWLEVDTWLRANSHGRRGLEDFAHAFFAGTEAGASGTSVYDLPAVEAGLTAVSPRDWRQFFAWRLNAAGEWDPLAGLRQGGYELVFDEVPGPSCTADEARLGWHCFATSVGLTVDDLGEIRNVEWNGPAFRAGLAPGMKLLSVGGRAFTPAQLERAVAATPAAPAPLRLIARDRNQVDVVDIEYHGGPRYPHLRRIPGTPAVLDAILEPHAAACSRCSSNFSQRGRSS